MNFAPGKRPQERLRVSSTAVAGRTVVTVVGEIDHETAGRLGDDLKAAVLSGARRVEVDFSRVGFCDCAGLNVLLAARIHCQGLGVGFSVSGPVAPAVARLFRLADTDALLLVSQAA
ncbi:STAS domain-containing protein [Streptomyces swartbergensis]|uniref:STAS domain-containing protein n=1 Tax=Streptomyces swartbergensis TaxID=487165 RepID=UPI00130250CA|nr:STAS domain-containing protein [Streptomyces swartbergensis]